MRKLILLAILCAVPFCNTFLEKALYCTAGKVLFSLSSLAELSGSACYFFDFPQYAKECETIRTLSKSLGKRFFQQAIRKRASSKTPSSQNSWHEHQKKFETIPTTNEEEAKLLSFFQKRWLAKSNGFFSSVIDWVYPCFDVFLQIHPSTTSCYSRNPSSKMSTTYLETLQNWKKKLSLSEKDALILTRPFDLKEYLPGMIISENTLSLDINGEKRMIGIEQIKEQDLGGIVIHSLDDEDISQEERFLLEWIGARGLTANRVELDRSFTQKNSQVNTPFSSSSFSLISLLKKKPPKNPEKRLFFDATMKLLLGLLEEKILLSPFEKALYEMTLKDIDEKFDVFLEEPAFFASMSYIDEIHANLTVLLEILPLKKPFSKAYHKALHSIPENLLSFTKCTLHTSGMTSYTGIFKAAEKMLGRAPNVLYGENTYYECIHVSEEIAPTCAIKHAEEENWKNVDLLIVQFPPVLCRTDDIQKYGLENISSFVQKALNASKKPLLIALDCTLDYINSPLVKNFLHEYCEEILSGRLCILGYRSGLKFDLFGMDNYCGAPFFRIHNEDSKWDALAHLDDDPVLQTDPLSEKWFSLAYTFALDELEKYRRMIFDNTRKILENVDNKEGTYRIIPFTEEVLPSFIEIRVEGPFHQARAGAIVGGILYMGCMENEQPIFTRPSLGFYHPNLSMIFGDDSSTVRLTVGIDPLQVSVITDCLQRISRLN